MLGLARPTLVYMALAWVGFGCLLFGSVPAPTDSPGRPPTSRSAAFLALHLGCGLLINCLFHELSCLAEVYPLTETIWLTLGAFFCWSWLGSWTDLNPKSWSRVGRAAAQAAIVTAVSVPLAHLADLLWNRWLAAPAIAATFNGTRLLLQAVYRDVVTLPDAWSVGTETFRGEILQECAGYQGVRVIVLFSLVYLYVRRRELRFPAAVWLIPIGIVASLLGNCLRIALLIIMATSFSRRVAVHGFHHQGGWLALLLIGWGMVLAVEKFGLFGTAAATATYPTVPYVLPLAVLLFGWMLSRAFSVGFDYFYPLRLVPVVGVLAYYRQTYRAILQRPRATSLLIGLAVYLFWAGVVTPLPILSPLAVLGSTRAVVWIAVRIVGAVVVIPLVEELAFRGYLLRALQATDFESVPLGQLTLGASLGSALAFGLLHQQVLAGTLAGLAYALAVRRRNLSDAIVAHATTNFCLAVQVLATAQWGLWD